MVMGNLLCALLAFVLIGIPAVVTAWSMFMQAPSGRRGEGKNNG